MFLEHLGGRTIDDLPNAAELRSVKLPEPEPPAEAAAPGTQDELALGGNGGAKKKARRRKAEPDASGDAAGAKEETKAAAAAADVKAPGAAADDDEETVVFMAPEEPDATGESESEENDEGTD